MYTMKNHSRLLFLKALLTAEPTSVCFLGNIHSGFVVVLGYYVGSISLHLISKKIVLTEAVIYSFSGFTSLGKQSVKSFT